MQSSTAGLYTDSTVPVVREYELALLPQFYAKQTESGTDAQLPSHGLPEKHSRDKDITEEGECDKTERKKNRRWQLKNGLPGQGPIQVGCVTTATCCDCLIDLQLHSPVSAVHSPIVSFLTRLGGLVAFPASRYPRTGVPLPREWLALSARAAVPRWRLPHRRGQAYRYGPSIRLLSDCPRKPSARLFTSHPPSATLSAPTSSNVCENTPTLSHSPRPQFVRSFLVCVGFVG